jgi:hypothetical protein
LSASGNTGLASRTDVGKLKVPSSAGVYTFHMKAPKKIRDNYFAPAGSVAERLYLQELRNKIVLSDADRALVKKLLAERNYETRTKIWDIAKHRLLGNAYIIARERHNELVDKLGEDAWYVAYLVTADYRDEDIWPEVATCLRNMQKIKRSIRKLIAAETKNGNVRNVHIGRWFLGN